MIDEPDHRPPLFRTWNQWYAAVVIQLAALIGFFYWFTRYFD
ncbi:MAG: hypothetical protein WBA12_15615 [Catalinimonas sp.]